MIVDKQNTMRVPKYGCHNLASPLLSFWCRNFFLPRLNNSKQRSETSTRCCFWSGMSKRGTHFGNNLRTPKDSCKILNTLRSNIFKVSAISRRFNLRSPKIILCTFVVSRNNCWFWAERAFSVIGVCTTAFTFGIPVDDCSFSLMPSPHNAYEATALLQQYFFPLKSNVWLTLETPFWHLTFGGWYYPEIVWIWQQFCYLYVRPETYCVICYNEWNCGCSTKQ